MLLSKRILVFTDEEVLYKCDSEGAWRESVFAEHPGTPPRFFSLSSSQSSFKLRLDPIFLGASTQGNDSEGKWGGTIFVQPGFVVGADHAPVSST